MLDEQLHKDPSLLRTILKLQVDSNSKAAREFVENRNIAGFINLMHDITPEAAILLHLDVSLVNPSLLDASAVLSYTLAPLVNKVCDFSFLPEDSTFIFGRFLHSMMLHYRDSGEPLG